MEQRVHRPGEVFVELALSNYIMADRPEVVEQQVVDALREQRKAVDKYDLVNAPAHKRGYLAENRPEKEQVGNLYHKKSDYADQKVALVLHHPFQLLRDENTV